MKFMGVSVPQWASWAAQDPDGSWWVYECEPLQHDNGWYENEIGRHLKLFLSSENPNWSATLKKIR